MLCMGYAWEQPGCLSLPAPSAYVRRALIRVIITSLHRYSPQYSSDHCSPSSSPSASPHLVVRGRAGAPTRHVPAFSSRLRRPDVLSAKKERESLGGADLERGRRERQTLAKMFREALSSEVVVDMRCELLPGLYRQAMSLQ